MSRRDQKYPGKSRTISQEPPSSRRAHAELGGDLVVGRPIERQVFRDRPRGDARRRLRACPRAARVLPDALAIRLTFRALSSASSSAFWLLSHCCRADSNGYIGPDRNRLSRSCRPSDTGNPSTRVTSRTAALGPTARRSRSAPRSRRPHFCVTCLITCRGAVPGRSRCR